MAYVHSNKMPNVEVHLQSRNTSHNLKNNDERQMHFINSSY